MKSECIDFHRLPGPNELFVSYLRDFERVRSFYPSFPISAEQLDKRVEKVRQTPHFPRELLIPVLRRINGAYSSEDAVEQSLKKLESEDTLAVVTGQQVGLFGGPSFGVYKAATAVRVAQYLESNGYSAVPVFWLASDDSDFEEVRSAHFFDHDGGLSAIRHPEERQHTRQMAGTVKTNPACVREFEEKVQGEGTHDSVLQLITKSYGSAKDFREAYALWLSGLFGRHGLVLFDPLAPGYREHLTEFFGIATTRREELLANVQRRNDELKDSGLPVQVRVDDTETFLFLIDPPNRFKLEYRQGYYQARGKKSFRLEPEEFRRQVEKGEITIGVNVLLRPILQEFLFPCFGAVTGPAEIAYLAQVNALSPDWNQEIAAIPRAAFTLVEPRAQRLLKKYSFEAVQVIESTPIELAREVLRQGEAAQILDDFDELRRDLSRQITSLKDKLEAEDPTVAASLEGAARKIQYQIDKVSRRFVLNHHTHETHRVRHLNYLGDHLLPRNHLQERVVNFNSFLLKEGHRLVEEILEKIDPENLSHQILYL